MAPVFAREASNATSPKPKLRKYHRGVSVEALNNMGGKPRSSSGGNIMASFTRRDFIASAPTGRTVTIYQPDDTLNVIDLLLVTDLQVGPTSANGSRKRRKD